MLYLTKCVCRMSRPGGAIRVLIILVPRGPMTKAAWRDRRKRTCRTGLFHHDAGGVLAIGDNAVQQLVGLAHPIDGANPHAKERKAVAR